MSERTDPFQDLTVDVDGWAPLGWEPSDPGLCDDMPFGTVLSEPVPQLPVPAREQQVPQQVPQAQQVRYGTVPKRRRGAASQQGGYGIVPGHQPSKSRRPQQAGHGAGYQVPQYRPGPAPQQPQRPVPQDVFVPRGRPARAQPQKVRTQKSGWSVLFWIALIAFGILRTLG